MLSLRIYGTDENGRPFCEDASAHQLTKQTALLEGITHCLNSGAILGLQYNARKARAQVMWVGDVDQSSQITVGIRLLPAEGCPWVDQLRPAVAAQESDFEKRRHPRHKIRIGVDLQGPDSEAKLQAQCSDISQTGCYVHTLYPWPSGTPLVAVIWLNSERIEVTAVVRTSDQNVGMGIEFMNLCDEEDRRLQQFLAYSLTDPSLQI